MIVRRGDIVLVDFPQQPGQPPKRRPALVVQADRNNARLSSTVEAMITSNTRLATREPTQVLIELGSPAGAQSGLTQTSAVKCENLYTFPLAAIRRTIGSLPGDMMRRVDEALKESLDIP